MKKSKQARGSDELTPATDARKITTSESRRETKRETKRIDYFEGNNFEFLCVFGLRHIYALR